MLRHMPDESTQIVVRIPVAMREELRKAALESERTPSQEVRLALRHHLGLAA